MEAFLWARSRSPVFPTRTTWRHDKVSHFQNTTTALWFRWSILSGPRRRRTQDLPRGLLSLLGMTFSPGAPSG